MCQGMDWTLSAQVLGTLVALVYLGSTWRLFTAIASRFVRRRAICAVLAAIAAGYLLRGVLQTIAN